jgi:signal transduction histidine kinase/outer membrane protein assembly factor BamB
MAARSALVGLLCLVCLAPPVSAGFSLRYRLVDRLSFGGNPEWHLLVADLNGDGDDDIVQYGPGRTLGEIVTPAGRRTLWDSALDPRAVVDCIADATGDGHPDLLIVTPRGSGFVVSCRDPRSPSGAERPIWEAGPYLAHCPVLAKYGVSGVVDVLSTVDVDGDGRPEVLVGLDPFAPGGEPRSLVCLDGATGRERWRYNLASVPFPAGLLVRRGDAGRHVILGSYATSNGFFVDGEDDNHCYVTSLSADGRREWSVPLGGVFCCAVTQLGDLDGDGEDDIVTSFDVSAANPDSATGKPRLMVLDPDRGRVLRAVGPPVSMGALRVADLDQDGRAEILGHGRDNLVYCFDGGLRLRWASRRSVTGFSGTADLDGDGHTSEVFGVSAATLVILSAAGDVIVERGMGQAIRELWPMRFEGGVRLACGTEAAHLILSLEPPTVPPAALALGGGVLVVGAGGLGYAVRRRRRGERLVERGEAQDRLLEAMMAFGHAGSALGVIHRLELHLKNWERVRERAEAAAAVQPLLEDFENSVLPDLARLVSLARRAEAKPQHWRPLAERALVVSGEVHELLDTPEAPEAHVRRALMALEQVDACLAGLRGHLRQVFRAPVVAALRRALGRHAEALAAPRVEVSLEVECAREAAGYISPPQLDNVLDNLVDNARRAMAKSEVRRLTIRAAPEGAYCRIEVTDTGSGLAVADHERIFDRDYSTREGGGFGLYFARQTLARYEGKIFVQHSAPGAGTTLRVLVRSA